MFCYVEVVTAAASEGFFITVRGFRPFTTLSENLSGISGIPGEQIP